MPIADDVIQLDFAIGIQVWREDEGAVTACSDCSRFRVQRQDTQLVLISIGVTAEQLRCLDDVVIVLKECTGFVGVVFEHRLGAGQCRCVIHRGEFKGVGRRS